MAAWSATGLAAASVIAVSVGMGLQGGGAAAAAVPGSALILPAAHRGDDAASPRVSAARPAARVTVPRQVAEDISGPCDELEHANDPRCAAPAARNPATPATRVEDQPRVGEDNRRADDSPEVGEDRGGDRAREVGDDRAGADRHGSDDSAGSSGRGGGHDGSGDDSGHGGHDGSGQGGSGR